MKVKKFLKGNLEPEILNRKQKAENLWVNHPSKEVTKQEQIKPKKVEERKY